MICTDKACILPKILMSGEPVLLHTCDLILGFFPTLTQHAILSGNVTTVTLYIYLHNISNVLKEFLIGGGGGGRGVYKKRA